MILKSASPMTVKIINELAVVGEPIGHVSSKISIKLEAGFPQNDEC